MNTQFANHSLNVQPIPIQDGGGFIGQSQILQDLLDQATRVANTDCRVLLMGESGTGKESLARAIHEKSYRRHNSFLKINCSTTTRETSEGYGIGFDQFMMGSSIMTQLEGDRFY